MGINKQAVIRRQEILRLRLGKAYNSAVETAIRSQYAVAAAVVRAKGAVAAQGHFHGDLVNTEIYKVIRSLYADAARMAYRNFKFAKEKLPRGRKDEGDDDQDQESSFQDRVKKFLDKYLLSEVVLPISQTSIKDIDRVLTEGINQGLGVEEIIARLENSDIPEWRAKMIVRTESARATNFTQVAAADDQDYEMEKQWIAIEDNRTRLTHSNHGGVDGERKPLYEPYSNGLMFPGDPRGGGAEVINCRCTQGFYYSRDLDGNLVKKQKNGLDLLSILNISSWNTRPSL